MKVDGVGKRMSRHGCDERSPLLEEQQITIESHDCDMKTKTDPLSIAEISS